MDEIKKTCECPAGGHCGYGGGGHRVIAWAIGIVILAIVFAIGVKVGEFRDELHNMYAGYYRDYPMMQRGYNGGGVAVPVTGGVQGTATGTSAAPMMPAQQ
jgi:hypothetical protein